MISIFMLEDVSHSVLKTCLTGVAIVMRKKKLSRFQVQALLQKGDEKLSCAKNLNCCSLPPCMGVPG